MRVAKLPDMKAPEGYVYLVIIPNHWGKGKTLKEAFTNVRRPVAGNDFNVFLTDPKAVLDETGRTIYCPTNGKPAIKIGMHLESSIQTTIKA